MLKWLVVVTLIVKSCAFRKQFNAEEARNFHWEDLQFVNETETSSDGSQRRRLKTTNPNDHKVDKLPGLTVDSKLVHYAGHITVDESKNGNLFYWLFEAPQNAKDLPLLIWLNGGPGCSSMDGLWLELGPLRLDNNNKGVKINPFSWHNVANLLFIDQPVGTGLSYTTSRDGYCKNDEEINRHFYKFLQSFFELHSRYVTTDNKTKLKSSRSFFMSGESHAGHYIPSMSAYILNKNKEIMAAKEPSNDVFITLTGIALGEGVSIL